MSTVIDDRKKGRSDRPAKNSRSHASVTRSGRGAVTTDRATRSKSAQRALDRRQRRLAPDTALAAVSRKRVGGIPLVFPVLLLIAGALGLTLYLTTKSAQNSYALDSMRQQNQTLEDKRDDLKRQHDLADSAPALADKAGDLGMVPADGAVQIVIGPDGKPHRTGVANASEGDRLPALNPAPDPVDEIDPKKVDDSEGLQGSGVDPAESTTEAPGSTTPTGRDGGTSTTPSTAHPAPPATQEEGPHPNVRPTTDQRRQVSTPQTNVTPPVDATPERNDDPAR